jgi:hypothetical protein
VKVSGETMLTSAMNRPSTPNRIAPKISVARISGTAFLLNLFQAQEKASPTLNAGRP